MRLLHFSDLHLDAPFKWAPRQVAVRRRQALRDTLDAIIALAATERVDALLCGGDLYEHDCFAPDTGDCLREAFARLHPTPVFLAPGNHDWYGPGSLYKQVDWTDNVQVFREACLQPVSLTDGVTLWGAGHRAPANTDGFLESFSVERDGVNLALFHGSDLTSLVAQGTGKIPHAPFDPAHIERAGLDHAFLGHFHRPRDDPRYTYPGNPEPLTFGEDGQRGVVLAKIAPDGGVLTERHSVAQTRVRDLTVTVSGCTSLQEVRARIVTALDGDPGIARVTLEGEVATQIDLRPELLDVSTERTHVEVRVGAITIPYDYDAIAGERTVRGRFVCDVRAASDLTEDERRRVLVTGLRALEGRDDLEVL